MRSISRTGLFADLGGSAAFCDMLPRSTSGCRCGGAWRIGGSVMETPNLPAIRALRPAWNKGPHSRPEATAETKTRLGDQGST